MTKGYLNYGSIKKDCCWLVKLFLYVTLYFSAISPVPANPLPAWPDVCNGAAQVQSHRVTLWSPPVSHNALYPSAASPSTWLRTSDVKVE